MKQRVAVVGAGWSGLACALALLDGGADVMLLDAAPQVGGRARRVDVQLGDRQFALDNGQHLLIGAYRETLHLMQRVGVVPAQAFVRVPFGLRYADGFALAARRAPAPLHLAFGLAMARGLAWPERVAMARWVQRQARAGWRLAADVAAIELFADQPHKLVDRLWEPLCLAALNVRLAAASGRVLLAVLRDSLGADRAASDVLLARSDLSRLLPDAAQMSLEHAGAQVRCRHVVTSLARADQGWQLGLRGDVLHADRVVLALPPDRAAALLESVGATTLIDAVAQLQAIATAPIATVYLRYPTGTRLRDRFNALTESVAAGRYGQWVFDRGAVEPENDGVWSVVISGQGPHLGVSRDALVASVAAQLQGAYALPAPLAAAVLVEKRATIVPAPGLRRPPASLPVTGLYLAGDAADSPYPSTIEGSVRAGLQAARAVLSAD